MRLRYTGKHRKGQPPTITVQHQPDGDILIIRRELSLDEATAYRDEFRRRIQAASELSST